MKEKDRLKDSNEILDSIGRKGHAPENEAGQDNQNAQGAAETADEAFAPQSRRKGSSSRAAQDTSPETGAEGNPLDKYQLPDPVGPGTATRRRRGSEKKPAAAELPKPNPPAVTASRRSARNSRTLDDDLFPELQPQARKQKTKPATKRVAEAPPELPAVAEPPPAEPQQPPPEPRGRPEAEAPGTEAFHTKSTPPVETPPLQEAQAPPDVPDYGEERSAGPPPPDPVTEYRFEELEEDSEPEAQQQAPPSRTEPAADQSRSKSVAQTQPETVAQVMTEAPTRPPAEPIVVEEPKAPVADFEDRIGANPHHTLLEDEGSREEFFTRLSNAFERSFANRFFDRDEMEPEPEPPPQPEPDIRQSAWEREPETPTEEVREPEEQEPLQQAASPLPNTEEPEEGEDFLKKYERTGGPEEYTESQSFRETLSHKYMRERQRYLKEFGVAENAVDGAAKPLPTPPSKVRCPGRRILDFQVQPEMHRAAEDISPSVIYNRDATITQVPIEQIDTLPYLPSQDFDDAYVELRTIPSPPVIQEELPTFDVDDILPDTDPEDQISVQMEEPDSIIEAITPETVLPSIDMDEILPPELDEPEPEPESAVAEPIQPELMEDEFRQELDRLSAKEGQPDLEIDQEFDLDQVLTPEEDRPAFSLDEYQQEPEDEEEAVDEDFEVQEQIEPEVEILQEEIEEEAVEEDFEVQEQIELDAEILQEEIEEEAVDDDFEVQEQIEPDAEILQEEIGEEAVDEDFEVQEQIEPDAEILQEEIEEEAVVEDFEVQEQIEPDVEILQEEIEEEAFAEDATDSEEEVLQQEDDESARWIPPVFEQESDFFKPVHRPAEVEFVDYDFDESEAPVIGFDDLLRQLGPDGDLGDTAEAEPEQLTDTVAEPSEEDTIGKTPPPVVAPYKKSSEELIKELQEQVNLAQSRMGKDEEDEADKELLPVTVEAKPEKSKEEVLRFRLRLAGLLTMTVVLVIIFLVWPLRIWMRMNGLAPEDQGENTSQQDTMPVEYIYETRINNTRAHYTEAAIRRSDITVDNMQVDEYLIIEEMEIPGMVTLSDVEAGTIHIKSCAVETLDLVDVKTDRIIIDNDQGPVSIIVGGISDIKIIEAHTPASLLQSGLDEDSGGIRQLYAIPSNTSTALNIELDGLNLSILETHGDSVFNMIGSQVANMSSVGALSVQGGGHITEMTVAFPEDASARMMLIKGVDVSNLDVKGGGSLNVSSNIYNLTVNGDTNLAGTGTIENLVLAKGDGSSRVKLDADQVKIETVTCNHESRIYVRGSGQISAVVANASTYVQGNRINQLICNNDNVFYEKKPDRIEVGSGIEEPRSMLENGLAGEDDEASRGENELVASGAIAKCEHPPQDGGFTEGDGTAENPFKVTTAAQLAHISLHSNANFIQTEDINISHDNNYSDNFPMICENTPFTGVYDGKGYRIMRLKIVSNGVNVGLFAENSGTVQNVSLEAGEITGSSQSISFVGGIVGLNNDKGKVLACSNGNRVNGNGSSFTGGVAGYNFGGGIEDCYNFSIITGGNNIGGIVGKTQRGAVVANCYNAGTIQGGNNTGSLVGLIEDATVTNCYYLSGTAPSGVGSGQGEIVEKDSTQLASKEMVNELSAGSSSSPWVQGASNGYSYPVHKVS